MSLINIYYPFILECLNYTNSNLYSYLLENISLNKPYNYIYFTLPSYIDRSNIQELDKYIKKYIISNTIPENKSNTNTLTSNQDLKNITNHQLETFCIKMASKYNINMTKTSKLLNTLILAYKIKGLTINHLHFDNDGFIDQIKGLVFENNKYTYDF